MSGKCFHERLQLHVVNNGRPIVEFPGPVPEIRDRSTSFKPLWKTGIWTSTYVGGRSDWLDYVEEYESPEHDTWCGFILRPDPAAKVACIRTYDDVHKLSSRYGTAMLYPGRSPLPDLDGITHEGMKADGYAGIHLTPEGRRNWHVLHHGWPNFSDWDCESTIWFDWYFTDWIGPIPIAPLYSP